MEAADYFQIRGDTMTAFVQALGGPGKGHGTQRAAEALNLAPKTGIRQIQRIILGEKLKSGEVQGYNREGKPIKWDGKGTVYNKDGRELEVRGMGKAVREQLEEALGEAEPDAIPESDLLRDGITVERYTGTFDVDSPPTSDHRASRTITRPVHIKGADLAAFAKALREGDTEKASDAFNVAYFTAYEGPRMAIMSNVTALAYRIGE